MIQKKKNLFQENEYKKKVLISPQKKITAKSKAAG